MAILIICLYQFKISEHINLKSPRVRHNMWLICMQIKSLFATLDVGRCHQHQQFARAFKHTRCWCVWMHGVSCDAFMINWIATWQRDPKVRCDAMHTACYASRRWQQPRAMRRRRVYAQLLCLIRAVWSSWACCVITEYEYNTWINECAGVHIHIEF